VCAIQLPRDPATEAELSLAEMERLVHSASGEVADSLILHLRSVDPGLFLTRGKVRQLAACAEAFELTGIVFDRDFSPVQVRNLTDEIGVRIIGRTELILDIFARRARTHEGKIQVELAQLQYVMPRLIGKGFAMSRLGGGIGTRGPGETRLEMDRRRIADRIAFLKRELAGVRQHRETQRKQRIRHEVPSIALLGYTNAGKSTLLNTLSEAHVPTADQLFATLDPMARRVTLPDGRVAVFSDTVGFIRDLPPTLIAAFKATLEEVLYADLLVHVVDASSPTIEREIQTTEEILDELGASQKPLLRVYNKIDRGLVPAAAELLEHADVPTVAISALYHVGIRDLVDEITRLTRPETVTVLLRLPATAYQLLYRLYGHGKVLHTEFGEEAILVRAEIEKRHLSECASYVVESEENPSA
jgi:GTP-binding protein HflX